MKAIYKKELRSAMNSMTGWFFAAALSALLGVYFTAYNLFFGDPYFSTSLSATLFLLVVLVPILTMRSLAEERQSRTDQLLLTSPVSLSGVVLGKFLALVTVFALPVLLAGLCPLIIRLNGTAFLKADYGTLLAFFLLGAMEIALGLFLSSLTASPMIAALGTFAVLLLLSLWEGLLDFLPASSLGNLLFLAAALLLCCLLIQVMGNHWKFTAALLVLGGGVLGGAYLHDSAAFAGIIARGLGRVSPMAVFQTFALDHVLSLTGLLLYLSLTGLLLFLTVQILRRRRWN